MPNKWLQTDYGRALRRFFLTKNLEKLIDFGDVQIFGGATTYPCIFIAQNGESQPHLKTATLGKDFKGEGFEHIPFEMLDKSMLNEDTWVISSVRTQAILERLRQNFITLKEFVRGEAYYGVKTGLEEAFFIDEATLSTFDENSKRFVFPMLRGRDIKPYEIPAPVRSYLIRIERGFTKSAGIAGEKDGESYLAQHFPALFNYLLPFKERAKKRNDQGDFWWELRACDYYEIFAKSKIMYQKFQVKPCFIYDESGLYCNDTIWLIPTDNKGLLALLNSKMGWWLISKYCTQIQNGYALNWVYFSQIPIPRDLSTLTPLANEMIRLHERLREVKVRFYESLECEKLSKKLLEFWRLGFEDFIIELAKCKKIKLKDKLEERKFKEQWKELFMLDKRQASELTSEIKSISERIDERVFTLYDLNSKEIELIKKESKKGQESGQESSTQK
ncbi:MAG: TaqI-like C-terminal specificity domain-containing protein [Wolinella sp.]